MAIPKSDKLVKEDKSKTGTSLPSFITNPEPEVQTSGPIKIREVMCCNDYVAILLFMEKSTIALPEEQKHKNEGVVIGVGPGVPAADGTRTPSQLRLGDVVMFLPKNIITEVAVDSSKSVYKDQRIVILSERSILTKLLPVEVEILK